MSEAIFLTWFFGASLTWTKSELVRQFLRRFREAGWVEREPRSVLQRAVNYVNAIFPLSPLIRRFWSLKQLQRVVNRTLELINRSRRKHSNGGQVTSLMLWTLCDPVNCSPPCSVSMGFSRQEYWRGLPFPPPGDLPDLGIKPMPSAWAGGFFTTSPLGKL